MRQADLDAFLAEMRIHEDNKRRVSEYLVDGKSMREIAAEHGCSPELVSSAVNRVRLRLNKSINPWAFTSISLTLPFTLAEELRGLSDALSQMKDTESANLILKDVLRAITPAKVKVNDHDQ